MNYILIEPKDVPIGSLKSKILSTVPQSSVMNINRGNAFESLKTLRLPPLLTDNWLVFINDRVSYDNIKNIFSITENNNIVHFEVTSKAEEVVNKLIEDGVGVKVINNNKLDKDEVEEYVSSSLDLSIEDTKYLCRRVRYNVKKIVESVNILSLLDAVERKDIKQYTNRSSKASVSDIVDKLLGYPNKRGTKGLVDLIYDYRFGFSYLKEYILKEINDIMMTYSAISSGELWLDNYQDFKGDAKMKSISKYRLAKYIEMYRVVSIDKLYLTKLKIEALRNNEIHLLLSYIA